MIDYLQLMQVPGHKENRTGEISEIGVAYDDLTSPNPTGKVIGWRRVVLSAMDSS